MEVEGSDTMAQIFRDYYKEYAIPTDASEIEIKRILRPLLQKYHPDAQEGKSEEEKELAKKEFSRVHEAYQTLTNGNTRRVYDLECKRRNQANGSYFHEYEEKSSKETDDFKRKQEDSGYKNFKDFYDFFQGQDMAFKKDDFNTNSSFRETNDSTESFNEEIRDMFQNMFKDSFDTSSEKVEEDFSEIIGIENQIKELTIKIENYVNQLSEVIKMRKMIPMQVAHLKNEIKKEKSYSDAISFLEMMREKEQNPLKRLFINQTDFEKKKICLELISMYDLKIEDYQRELEEQIKKKDEKLGRENKQYHANRKKKEELERAYLNHPLRLKYEQFKQKEEEEEKKAKVV